jgi:hypothetical protein
MTALLSPRAVDAPGGIGEVFSAIALMREAMLGNSHTREIADAIDLFDPFWFDAGAYMLLEANETTEEFDIAISVCRGTFPSAYANAVIALRRGDDLTQIENELVWNVNKILDPTPLGIESIEELTYGSVSGLYPVGFDIENGQNEWGNSTMPEGDLATVLSWFGVTEPVGSRYPWGQIRTFLESLERMHDERYGRLWSLVAWLFGLSGNTLVDGTWEMIQDMLAPDWSDLEFAILVQNDAIETVRNGEAAARDLLTDPDLQHIFRLNIDKVQHGATAEQLQWTCSPASSGPGATAADTDDLQPRRDIA